MEADRYDDSSCIKVRGRYVFSIGFSTTFTIRRNSPRTFLCMNKLRPQTQQNRINILKQCYRLMAQGTWDAISVAELEKNISQTRGAIFYFNKNKKDLFLNMIDELFFPVFVLSKDEKARLSACSVSQFHATYKTPFDRLKEDLSSNYCLPNPAQAVFNIIVQAQKHYADFSVMLKRAYG